MGKILAIIGALLHLGPVYGLAGTAIGMVKAFDTISTVGKANPAALNEHISLALSTTAEGLIAAAAGIVFVYIAFKFCQYRERWFYHALALISAFWMLFFPLGTILGGLCLYRLTRMKQEFCEPITQPESA